MLIAKPETEKSVLSSIIFDNNEYWENPMSVELFTGIYQQVFEAIKIILDSGGHAGIGEIYAQIGSKIEAWRIKDIEEYPISANVSWSLKDLVKANNLRKIKNGLQKGLEKCDTFSDESEIESIVTSAFLSIIQDAPDFKADMLHAYEQAVNVANGIEEIGLKTGIYRLDDKIGSLKPGDLVIIAGRPGDGKTSLAMNMVRNFCQAGVPGAIFSLEMSTGQLAHRLVCDIMGINGALIFLGKSQYLGKADKINFLNALEKGFDILYGWPIIIDDRPRLTVDDIIAQSRKLAIQKNIQFIVVDHSREIVGWNTEGQETKSEIVSKLKAAAKEFNAPVILLSQLNREIEKRGKYIPKNSDLKDTGALEEKADLILFPNVEDREGFTNGNEIKSAKIFCTKNRSGNIGEIEHLKWQGQFFRFSDK